MGPDLKAMLTPDPATGAATRWKMSYGDTRVTAVTLAGKKCGYIDARLSLISEKGANAGWAHFTTPRLGGGGAVVGGGTQVLAFCGDFPAGTLMNYAEVTVGGRALVQVRARARAVAGYGGRARALCSRERMRSRNNAREGEKT